MKEEAKYLCKDGVIRFISEMSVDDLKRIKKSKENRRFMLDMKDFWNSDDSYCDAILYMEIKDIEKELKKRGE